MEKKQIVIEGNIGCGKSTLLGTLSNDSNVEVFLEPLNAWQDIKTKDGETLLSAFYRDPKRYGYLFQSIVFKTRLRYQDIPQEKQLRYMERSVLTDNYVFMKSMIEMEMIEDIEQECYKQWYSWLTDKVFKMPDAIIYIRSSPETCLTRIKHRNREAETNILIDYLKTIHDKHEEWLQNWNLCPVYVVENPIDRDINSVLEEVKNIGQKIINQI